MRVYGEAYLFINFCMDFLSLLLAARLKRARFHGLRAAVGAVLGAVYSVACQISGGFLNGLPAALFSLLVIALISFGRTGVLLFPWVAGTLLLFSGLAEALSKIGASAAAVLAVCGACALAVCLSQGKRRFAQADSCELTIVYRGRRVSLPAVRDSGNLLTDGLTGRPVIVAPEKAAFPLLPEGVQSANIATLPPGWRLLPIRTASGNALLMTFRPDAAKLIQDGKARKVDAAIAVSACTEKAALVPECLFF